MNCEQTTKPVHVRVKYVLGTAFTRLLKKKVCQTDNALCSALAWSEPLYHGKKVRCIKTCKIQEKVHDTTVAPSVKQAKTYSLPERATLSVSFRFYFIANGAKLSENKNFLYER